MKYKQETLVDEVEATLTQAMYPFIAAKTAVDIIKEYNDKLIQSTIAMFCHINKEWETTLLVQHMLKTGEFPLIHHANDKGATVLVEGKIVPLIDYLKQHMTFEAYSAFKQEQHETQIQLPT